MIWIWFKRSNHRGYLWSSASGHHYLFWWFCSESTKFSALLLCFSWWIKHGGHFGFFAQNIICDVSIDWSCSGNCQSETYCLKTADLSVGVSVRTGYFFWLVCTLCRLIRFQMWMQYDRNLSSCRPHLCALLSTRRQASRRGVGCGMHLAIMMWGSVSSKKLDLVRNSIFIFYFF